MPFIVISLLLAAALGGRMAVMAQSSLPGDLLWSFKVNINEKIQAALEPEGIAQANFDISTMETRTKEADVLAASGKLSADIKNDIMSNFAEHTKSVEAQVTKLEDGGYHAAAAQVAASLQAELAKHASGALDVRSALDAASVLSAETSVQAK